MRAKRLPSWDDVKSIIEFKTFYLALVLGLIGVCCLLLEVQVFRAASTSAFKGIFQGFGLTLITSSAVSVLAESALRFDMVEFVTSRVREETAKVIGSGRASLHPDLAGYFQARDDIDFSKIVREARDHLWIVGVSANDILSPQPLHALRKRLNDEPGFRVRILILNPWSTAASQRARHPAYTKMEVFYEKAAATLNALLDFMDLPALAGSARLHIELRLMDSCPTVSAIHWGDAALVTPLNAGRTGGASPTFLFQSTESSQCAFRVFGADFEAHWLTARSVNREHLATLQKESLEDAVRAGTSARFTSLKVANGRIQV